MAPFLGPKIGEEDQKKSSQQNEQVLGPKICADQTKKKVFSAKSEGLRFK